MLPIIIPYVRFSILFFFFSCLLAGCRDPRGQMLMSQDFVSSTLHPHLLNRKFWFLSLSRLKGWMSLHPHWCPLQTLEVSFLSAKSGPHLLVDWHFLFCDLISYSLGLFNYFMCLWRTFPGRSRDKHRYNPSWLNSSPVWPPSELTLETQILKSFQK